jgi:hypothetical protein
MLCLNVDNKKRRETEKKAKDNENLHNMKMPFARFRMCLEKVLSMNSNRILSLSFFGENVFRRIRNNYGFDFSISPREQCFFLALNLKWVPILTLFTISILFPFCFFFGFLNRIVIPSN